MPEEPPRILSLHQLCLRVITAHSESLVSLGSMPYRIARPILQTCSVETLRRIEQHCKHLLDSTQEIWRERCFSFSPDLQRQYEQGERKEPRSWRLEYAALVKDQEERLVQAGSRLRNSRKVLESQKRETIHDPSLQPRKKMKTSWGVPAPPATLFQAAYQKTKKLTKLSNVPLQRKHKSLLSVGFKSSSSSTSSVSSSRVSTLNILSTTPCVGPVSTPASTQVHGPLSLSSRQSSPIRTQKDPYAVAFIPKSRTVSQLPSGSQSTKRPPVDPKPPLDDSLLPGSHNHNVV